jgi:glutathione S-transferase
VIIFYGSPMSSAGRTHWMLEEVGVPYEYKRVDLRDEASRGELLSANPGGKIPFLIDGDVRLAESMAINFYLAEKYKPELMPRDLAERALVYQWSFWGISNFQPEALKVMLHSMFLPEDERVPRIAEAAKRECDRYLAFLEKSFAGEYILGKGFTVADVNAGSAVNLGLMVGGAVGPKVAGWMERLKARPAYQRAAQNG